MIGRIALGGGIAAAAAGGLGWVIARRLTAPAGPRRFDLPARGFEHDDNGDLIVLDGNHDWLTPPERVGLFEFAEAGSGELSVGSEASARGAHLFAPYAVSPPVTTMIKADLKCSSVASASVLAKVERDELMITLADAEDTYARYGWGDNKGYSAPEHLAALAAHGPCALHRRSWRLPGVMTQDAGMSAEEGRRA